MLNTDKIFFAFSLIKSSFWRFRKKFLLMLVLGLFVGLFGGLGIGAIIPIFALILKDRGTQYIGTEEITKKVEQLFSFFHLEYNLFFLLGFIVVLFLAKAALTYLAGYLNEKIATEYEKETGRDLFKKTLEADWPYLMEQKIGHLNSILIQSVNSSAGMINHITSILMTSTSLIMYAVIALNISPPITLITLCLGIVVFLILKPVFYRIRKSAHQLAIAGQDVSHHIGEHIIGAKTIKATGSENQIIKRGENYFEDLKNLRLKVALYNKITGSILEPLGIIFISGLFIFYYYTNTGFNIASFAAIIYLIQKKISFIQTIQAKLNNINEALPQLKIVEDYKKITGSHKEINFGEKLFTFKDELVLKNISFAYQPDIKILEGLSLTIKKGEMVGLIGPSGAGKTTLVDIILRLLDPGAGEILIDGNHISEIELKEWRKKIGYVSQDIFLLNDTIENNIKFYNESIEKDEVEKFAKMANALDFIEKLPEKFQAVIGERGVKLSAGQRQRIILARTLARKPEILILDEATSALDNESEVMIQKSIEALHRQITVIAIAHRLSTIMKSDRLAVLDEGKIIEDGKPDLLLKDKDSYFYRVYNIH